MEEALKANLYHKPNLSELRFAWHLAREAGETNDESVLEGLQPQAELKKLEIRGYRGKKFPTWTQDMAVRDDGPQQGSPWVPLDNLIEITLDECSECDEIPMMWHLPNLKSLSLIKLENVKRLPDGLLNNIPDGASSSGSGGGGWGELVELKNETITNSSFNKLTKLKLVRLEKLECLPCWLFHNNLNLSEVEITGCLQLRELPDGLHALTSLEHLRILKCPKLKSIVGIDNNSSGGSRILRKLYIGECGELDKLPYQVMDSWANSLEELELRELGSLQNLSMVIDCLAKSTARLKNVKILGVPRFMTAGSSSGKSWSCGSSLRGIEIDISMDWSSESSASIGKAVEGMLLGCCNSLTLLRLKGNIDWDWLPGSIQHLLSLKILQLESLGVQELPEWLGNLSSLNRLCLKSCNKLRHMPRGDAYVALTNLWLLTIEDCQKLEVGYEWHNIPYLAIYVDGRRIKSPT